MKAIRNKGILMYQIEVKLNLIKKKFNPKDGWNVMVDIDAMEMGTGSLQKPEKREIAEKCWRELNELGVTIGSHPLYGRADIVANHPTFGSHVIEVEGNSSKQLEQAMYSAIGQVVLSMHDSNIETEYGLAVPHQDSWFKQLKKIPLDVCHKLSLSLYLVNEEEVVEFFKA